jgi:hypothetical protein
MSGWGWFVLIAVVLIFAFGGESEDTKRRRIEEAIRKVKKYG